MWWKLNWARWDGLPRTLRDIRLTQILLATHRQLVREGKAKKDHRNRTHAILEACPPKVRQPLPHRSTKGRPRPSPCSGHHHRRVTRFQWGLGGWGCCVVCGNIKKIHNTSFGFFNSYLVFFTGVIYMFTFSLNYATCLEKERAELGGRGCYQGEGNHKCKGICSKYFLFPPPVTGVFF